MSSVSVIIVDDHPIFIQGLKIILDSNKDYNVVGEAGDGKTAFQQIAEKKPDLVIVDLNLGNEDGLDLIKQIKKLYPEMKTLVLSMLDERNYAERALLAGARGYIMKEETADVLLSALDTVIAGEIWLSPREKSRYLDALFSSGRKSAGNTPQSLLESLSDRQLLVLSLMGKGLGTLDIAEKLFISPRTVEAHKDQIKKKLRCKSSQELLQFAIEWANRRY